MAKCKTKAAEPDTGSKVYVYFRKLRLNGDKKFVKFISPKALNLVNLHSALSVFGKLCDEQSPNFSSHHNYVQIHNQSDDIYLIYLDKGNVIYRKVYIFSTQSQSNFNIPVCRIQQLTDPNGYEAHTNVPFKCFGDEASLHESYRLLLASRSLNCAYSYCKWDNGIVFFHMKSGNTIKCNITHTDEDHIK